MHNARVMSIHHFPDHVNLRGIVCIVGIFGIITIISYFNELAKAGLLFRPTPYSPRGRYRLVHRQLRNTLTSGALLQRNGDVHQLGINIMHVRQALRKRTSNQNVSRPGSEEIYIAVHLRKNHTYNIQNNTSVSVYHYQNILPNFYNSFSLENIKRRDFNSAFIRNISSQIRYKRKQHQNATKAFLYQHEPGGYVVRDCLKYIAAHHGLVISNWPVNVHTRKEWEAMTVAARHQFQILYGGLVFGICEGIHHRCSYFAMLTHPLDRILNVYDICSRNASQSVCHFAKTNISTLTLRNFIRSQQNSLFHKLLYHSRHCRLVGQDEVCLQDGKTSFILTPAERKANLAHILEHLESWFSVVGLVDYFKLSIQLFQDLYGLEFASCVRHAWSMITLLNNSHLNNSKTTSRTEYWKEIKRNLSTDPQVLKWLGADIEIYHKLEDIFHRQVANFKTIRNLKNAYRKQNKNFHRGHDLHIRDSAKPVGIVIPDARKVAKPHRTPNRTPTKKSAKIGKQFKPKTDHHARTGLKKKHVKKKNHMDKSLLERKISAN